MKSPFGTSGEASPAHHNPSQNPSDPVVVRYAEAYRRMAAEVKYRPKAPGDGCGGIYLSAEELSDQPQLQREALEYGFALRKQEESGGQFYAGYTNWPTNRAFVFVIEAARLLNSGGFDDKAVALLKMAIGEVRLNSEP